MALATIIAVAPALAQERVASGQNAEADTQDIVVTGSRYRGEVASGGARIDADVKDLPLSISVVTKELIEDRQIRNLRDLSENVAGVRSRGEGSGAFAVDFTIRGLQSFGQNISLNGFRVESFSNGFDPQMVERVEFLKGPASVLYGASGALSGLVNIVTKTPQHDDFLTAEVTGGAPAYGRVGVDANLRLTDTLDTRVNAALTHQRSEHSFQDLNEQSVSQSVRWHPGRLSVLVEGTFFHAVQPSRGSENFPADRRFVDVPRFFKLDEPWSRDKQDQYDLRAEASWEVADGLTLRQGVNYQHSHEDEFNVYLGDSSGNVLLGPNLVAREASRSLADGGYLVSQSEVRWTFKLLGMSHKLLAGYEYSNEDTGNGGFCCDVADIAPLDLLHPVYGAPRPALGLTQYFNNTIRANAFYIQDFVEFGAFKLLAGLRRDKTLATSSFCDITIKGCPSDPIVSSLGSAADTAYSPRLGVVWKPGDRTTLFVSYAKSFNPNVSLDRNNKLLPPERGTQYELGVRQDLLGADKLALTATVFDLTRQNIASCDPLFLDCSRSIAVGEQRVRGAELEITGKPVDWIDVVATYAHLDGKVTKSDVVNTGIAVGSRIPEAAPNSASLFTRISLAPVGAKDVAVSAGVYYVSARPGRDFFGSFASGPFATPFTILPASTRLDLGAFWDASPRLRFQANLTNVFDTSIYEPVNVGFNLAERRRASLGITLKL